MTKQQAIEILKRTKRDPWDLLEALDRAGLFMSEETAAEIADCVWLVMHTDDRHSDTLLRLATACRKAGLVKT